LTLSIKLRGRAVRRASCVARRALPAAHTSAQKQMLHVPLFLYASSKRLQTYVAQNKQGMFNLVASVFLTLLALRNVSKDVRASPSAPRGHSRLGTGWHI
jgi:hypothetical protein